MDLWNKLFATKKPQIQLEATCPYCNTVLKKRPQAKTKCPSCGNFMYVRTRPSDRQKVIVTKKQADEIDEQWTIISGTHDQYLEAKEEYHDEKETLHKRFGQEPSDNDIKWSMLNKELLEHAKRADWGLYRNARLTMGDILRKEMKLKQAIETYLEVCYIDLNGPSNMGGLKDPEILRQYPPFNPKEGMVFPGVIEYIQRVNKKLGLSTAEIEKLYFANNQRVYSSLKLPISPEKTWTQLKEKLGI